MSHLWKRNLGEPQEAEGVLGESLHDIMHQNTRNHGSILHIQSCRIYIINSPDLQ